METNVANRNQNWLSTEWLKPDQTFPSLFLGYTTNNITCFPQKHEVISLSLSQREQVTHLINRILNFTQIFVFPGSHFHATDDSESQMTLMRDGGLCFSSPYAPMDCIYRTHGKPSSTTGLVAHRTLLGHAACCYYSNVIIYSVLCCVTTQQCLKSSKGRNFLDFLRSKLTGYWWHQNRFS